MRNDRRCFHYLIIGNKVHVCVPYRDVADPVDRPGDVPVLRPTVHVMIEHPIEAQAHY